MKILKLLAAEKIKIDKPAEGLTILGTHEVDCPKDYCRKARAQGDDTPMRVQIEIATFATFKCRHCLWTGHVGERPVEPEPQDDDLLPEPLRTESALPGLPGGASEYLRGVGVTAEMVARHRITWDDAGDAIRIPYRADGEDINAVLINPRTGTTRLEGPRICFFGERELRGSAEIIIARTELERLILLSCGFDNVLALPNGGETGSGQKDRYAAEEDKFAFIGALAEQFKTSPKIILAMDDTPVALALRTELARRLGPGKCWVVKFAADTLADTYRLSVDELCADINGARPLPIRGLYELADFEKELVSYFDTGMAAGVSTGWENVDKLYTVVPGQLTVITGIPNSGKSEWVDALTLNLAMIHGWRFAAFSPENGKEAHATKLIEKRVEMSADPRSKNRMSLETFASGMSWVQKHYTFIESTDVMPTLDWILERAADAALRYGIKGLVIDPWNRIEKKMDTFRSETDYVAAAIPRILRFLVNHGVHGWLVVHPSKQEKDRKSGEIPVPSLYDMAGSAHFVNMCDNGVVIHRSPSIDDTTEVHIKKVRFKHVGKRGLTKLSYSLNTGRYMPLDQAAKFTYGDDTAATDGIRSWEAD